MHDDRLSFYCASLPSQLAVLVTSVGGVLCTTLISDTTLERIAVGTFTLAGVFVANRLYGWVIRFVPLDQIIEIDTQILCFSVDRSRHYRFADIQSLNCRWDGDGFPFVEVRLNDNSNYLFFSFHTRRDYDRLRKLTGR